MYQAEWQTSWTGTTDHIEMAFSVLLSMPGIPIIYYGDEIGATNNFANAKKKCRLKERKTKFKSIKIKLLSVLTAAI